VRRVAGFIFVAVGGLPAGHIILPEVSQLSGLIASLLSFSYAIVTPIGTWLERSLQSVMIPVEAAFAALGLDVLFFRTTDV
jgi:hypothetical protein